MRATEGELQRTIAGLTPVESARVHIASPEASLYSTTQQPTTASVAMKTKPGHAALAARSPRHHATRLGRGRRPQARQRDDRRSGRHDPRAVAAKTPAASPTRRRAQADPRPARRQTKVRDGPAADAARHARRDDRREAFRRARRSRHELRRELDRDEVVRAARHGPLAAERSARRYNGTGGAAQRRAPAFPARPPTSCRRIKGRRTSKATAATRSRRRRRTTRSPNRPPSTSTRPGKVTRLSVAVLVNVPPRRRGAAAERERAAAVRRRRRRRAEDPQRRRRRRRHRRRRAATRFGRSDSVRAGAGTRAGGGVDVDDGARHPGRAAHRDRS